MESAYLNTTMIEGANDSILISTRGIDLLHDSLIDKTVIDDDIDIRILTNATSASGPRRKMKIAVMNELISRLQGNVREDELVHSRMVIVDEQEIVISSADLTRDQLYDEFNAGIYTQDQEEVEQAVEFFETMWEDADHREQR